MTPSELDVTVEADCGNTPRKAQVRDWLISLAGGDVDSVCSSLDEAIRWDVAGDRTHVGIDEVRGLVQRFTEEPTASLLLRHILSHGKQVCAGGATSTHRFSHIITYTGHGRSAGIGHVLTYLAPAPSG